MKSNQAFRVLIVDDMADDLARPYLVTTKLGFDVTMAFNGKQALHDVYQRPFDLVILDWNMPEITGHSFLSTLKAIDNRRLNVVIYTGTNLTDADIPHNQSFRIVDFWLKPIGPLDMVHRLRELRERIGR